MTKMTNKKTAELMISIMKYVIKEDYYPNDYYTLLELQNEYSNDLISNLEYETKLTELRIKWIK
jgi:hypothetical protein